MKIIEAMKQIKDLVRKADDLKAKAAQHCIEKRRCPWDPRYVEYRARKKPE